jgi:hypothetical protein
MISFLLGYFRGWDTDLGYTFLIFCIFVIEMIFIYQREFEEKKFFLNKNLKLTKL